MNECEKMSDNSDVFDNITPTSRKVNPMIKKKIVRSSDRPQITLSRRRRPYAKKGYHSLMALFGFNLCFAAAGIGHIR